MAVHSEYENNEAKENSTTAGPEKASADSQQRGSMSSNPFAGSIVDQLTSTLGSHGVVPSHGGVKARQYMEFFQAEIDDFNSANHDLKLNMVLMDADIYSLRASVILLINRMRKADNSGIVCAVHAFLLESTMITPLEPVPIPNAYINNEQLKLPRVPSDIMSSKYYNQQLRKCLTTASGGISRDEKALILDGGRTVIPSELVPGPEYADYLKNILVAGTFGIIHALRAHSGQHLSVNLADPAMQRLPLKVEPSYTTEALPGPNGRPLRQDVQITLTQKSRDMDPIDGPSGGQSFLTIGGFVDQIYVGPTNPQQQQQQYQMYGMTAPVDRRCFQPRFVITSVASRLAAYGPEFPLMGIALATVLQYPSPGNPFWARTFMPDMRKKKEQDLHDIGALCYDINFSNDPSQPVYEKLDTKNGEYSEEALVGFINQTHYMDRMIYAMDVDPSQPGGWVMEQFLKAARSKDPSHNRRLLDTMNSMVDGKFAVKMHERFGDAWTSRRLVTYNNELIMGGIYTDQKGVIQDHRRYDYLALLNEMMPNDRKTISEIVATLYDKNTQTDVRIAQRFRLFSNAHYSFKLTNWYYRLNFDPQVMQAFIEAWIECGSFPNTDLMSSFIQTGHVDTSNFLNMGYGGGSVSGFTAVPTGFGNAVGRDQFIDNTGGFGTSVFDS